MLRPRGDGETEQDTFPRRDTGEEPTGYCTPSEGIRKKEAVGEVRLQVPGASVF